MGGNGGASLFRGFSLDCTFSNSASVPRSMEKMALNAMLPFLLLFTFMLFWALRALKQKEDRSYIIRHWIVTAYVVFYISYTSMTETLLKLVICQSADNASNIGYTKSVAISWYWMEDTNITCYSDDHLVLLLVGAIPLTLVMFGAPVWLLYVLICHHDRLNEPQFLGTYGFFYKSYCHERQYWEVVIMARKVLLFVIIAFSHSLRPPLQLLLALGTLLISLTAHLFANPFLEDGSKLHMMEAASLSCSCFVFFVGLIFVDPKTSDTGRVIISVMLLSLLVATMIYLVGNLLLEFAKGIDGLLNDCSIATNTSIQLDTKVMLLGRVLLVRFKKKLWQQGSSTGPQGQTLVPAISMESQKMVAEGGPIGGSPPIVFSNSEKVDNEYWGPGKSRCGDYWYSSALWKILNKCLTCWRKFLLFFSCLQSCAHVWNMQIDFW